MDLDKYANPPEGIGPSECKALFNEFLDLLLPKLLKELRLMFEALAELADRQWHTYEPLDSETKKRIEVWISQNWEHHSIEITESILSIIYLIGLTGTCQMLQDSLSEKISDKVKELIIETFDEYGTDNISDPWSDLKDDLYGNTE